MIHRIAAMLPGMAAVLAALISAPASAEVSEIDDNGFVTRATVLVEAEPKEVWLALISPGDWWNSAHTWSGDAANMTLRPQAGGCFCERIPEDPDPDKITLEGSVEHMRVIQAFPEKVLRMRGGLGPLQSEAATGVLTIAIGEEERGTRIVWEYVVGGYMRYKTPEIAKAVDGVMLQQMNGLASKLGAVDAPAKVEEDESVFDAGPDETSADETSGGDTNQDESDEIDGSEQETSEDRMSALEEAVEALDDN